MAVTVGMVSEMDEIKQGKVYCEQWKLAVTF